MYPDEGDSYLQAKQVCAECPIKTECLEYALRNFEEFGVWGGLTPKQRRPLRRDYVRPLPPVREHGTERGYAAHRVRKEEPCHKCREAHNQHNREWKRAHPRDRRKVKT